MSSSAISAAGMTADELKPDWPNETMNRKFISWTASMLASV